MIAKIKLFLIDDNGATRNRIRSDRRRHFSGDYCRCPTIGTKLNTAFTKVSTALN